MSIHQIDPATLSAWLKRNEAVVVDVREPAEYAGGHIPGALLMPLRETCCGRLPDAAGRKLVINCQAGRRGDTACQALLREDPAIDIYHLAGGLAAWTAAGYDVQTSDNSRRILPLDRQVHLIVGCLIVLGSLLAYSVSPAFLWLTAFVGGGLFVDGLTGFCGLGRLLAHMPWNQRTNKRSSS